MILPSAVLAELSHPLAPASVQRWVGTAPAWLEVAESPAVTLSAGIHKGEAAAITLASAFHADLLLMDDRKGVLAAERQGLNVTGTLGVLDLGLWAVPVTQLFRVCHVFKQRILNHIVSDTYEKTRILVTQPGGFFRKMRHSNPAAV